MDENLSETVGGPEDIVVHLVATTSMDVVFFVVAIVALIILLWASYRLTKKNHLPWNKVIFMTLIGTIVIETLNIIFEYYLDWKIFDYIDGVLNILGASLFLLAVIAFFKIVNYINVNE